jgi:hypothetical protein
MTIYLYVKQHSVTGLKYFGKTTQNDPYKYKGSGLYWSNHIKTHGNLIETLEVWKFDDQEMCTEFALTFSKNNDIVKSKEWANLREENALDGNTKGNKMSAETKSKMCLDRKGKSSGFKGKTHSVETKSKMSIIQKGKTRSEESKTKMSIAKKGKKQGAKSAETRAKMSLAAKLRNHSKLITL